MSFMVINNFAWFISGPLFLGAILPKKGGQRNDQI